MNSMERSKGDIISDIVLIDGYPIFLRYNKIRERINTKLEEQACDGVYAQVEIDDCDRLTLVFYADKVPVDEELVIRENLDRDDSKSSALEKKTNFIEHINNVLILIQTKKMKNCKKGVAPSATKEECINSAQNVAKIINLCKGENASILKKAGFDVSEACRKLTNGVVDSVIVEDGIITFINNNGLSMSFNTIGHTEEDTISVITSYINSMAELSDIIKPLDESVSVTDNCDNVSQEERSEESIKVAKKKIGKLTTEQQEEYNRLIAQTIDSLDIDSGIGKRSFSQQLRGKMLHCARNAGLKKVAGTSIQALVKELTPVNVGQIRTVYELYGHKIPSWFAQMSTQGMKKKRAKV